MRYSLLDLSPIPEGEEAADAIAHSLDLAQHAEGWGYARHWLAEHHNMPGIASAATAVLIGHLAEHTRRIRIGAGGIMLPNHAPLMVAEAFGTLATIHGGRIDLGLGRAPGTDALTAAALRRDPTGGEGFPRDVVELLGYLGPADPEAQVRAIPGTGTRVPVWILGSSLFGAQLAALLGLPYAFAAHFAPAALEQAAALYRRDFRPSEHLEAPYFMLAVNVFAGETDAEGAILRSSMQQGFARLRAGRPGKLPRPVPDIARVLDAATLRTVDQALSVSAAGGPQRVTDQLAALVARHRPDEVIVTGQIHDHAARLRSFEIAAAALAGIDPPA